MKTKEEIAKETYLRITSWAPYDEMNGIPRATFEEKIADAAAEYAKQQAIAFDDWTAHNHVKYQKGSTWVCAGKVYEQPPTTEQIYAQFIEHQSQNKEQ